MLDIGQQWMDNSRLGQYRNYPTSTRLSDRNFSRAPGGRHIGRSQYTNQRVGCPQPLVEPQAPLLPGSDPIPQILSQEHLVAIIFQPPAHLTSQSYILARV